MNSKPKICTIAAGHLIVDGKILLIKHKKIGSWLSPGGHVDPDELPHQAAEREFFEETGIKVEAYSLEKPFIQSSDVQVLPQPLFMNLHWVSKDNYTRRTNNQKLRINANNPWKKGCEQHMSSVYLLKPIGSLDFYQNIEETDGIGWFTQEEVASLDMLPNIQAEIEHVFSL